jgi:hypothetical protein
MRVPATVQGWPIAPERQSEFFEQFAKALSAMDAGSSDPAFEGSAHVANPQGAISLFTAPNYAFVQNNGKPYERDQFMSSTLPTMKVQIDRRPDHGAFFIYLIFPMQAELANSPDGVWWIRVLKIPFAP